MLENDDEEQVSQGRMSRLLKCRIEKQEREIHNPFRKKRKTKKGPWRVVSHLYDIDMYVFRVVLSRLD